MKRRGGGICGGNPAGAERRTGAENYGRYNGYVEICIRDGLHGLLPDALPEGTRADYEYRYHCALLGDPAFAATLELTFDDAALYARERARLAGMALKRLAHGGAMRGAPFSAAGTVR